MKLYSASITYPTQNNSPMKNFFLFLALLSSLSLVNCNNESPSRESVVPDYSSSTPTLKRILLIIDGSNSLNSAACEDISRKVLRIFDALGEMNDIRVFFTMEGTKSQPVFQWKKTSPTKPSLEKKFFSETLPAKREEFNSIISQICKKGINGSFILHAIQSTYANIQGADQADQTFLLILSDMLECSTKYYGCSEIEGFEKMTAMLNNSSLGIDCQLSKVIPIENIDFCVISMNNEKRFIELSSSPECKKFWDAAFIKMGYLTGPEHATDIGAFIKKISS
jgi:hypothetical protein